MVFLVTLARVRRLRQPGRQVRAGAEERDLLVPARQRGVGQGAEEDQALPGRRAGAGGDRLRTAVGADRRGQAAHPGDRRQAQRRPAPAGRRGAAAGVLAQRPRGHRRPARRARKRPGRHVPDRRAVDPRPRRRLRRRAAGQADRRRRLQPRRDQGVRQHQRLAAPGRGADRPDPADRHLPLADLLDHPVLHRAARRGGRARARLPARRGRRDDQRPDGRDPARARVRRRHRLRAAARLALPRGAAPPRGQARGDGDRAAERRPRDPRLRPDRDRRPAVR